MVSPAEISLVFTLYAEVEDVAATPWKELGSLGLWFSGKKKPYTGVKRKKYLVAIFNVCITLYFITQFQLKNIRGFPVRTTIVLHLQKIHKN